MLEGLNGLLLLLFSCVLVLKDSKRIGKGGIRWEISQGPTMIGAALLLIIDHDLEQENIFVNLMKISSWVWCKQHRGQSLNE